MSAGVMRYTVVVRHPDTDAPTAVLAGKAVPDWAKDLVHKDDLVSAGKDGGNQGDSKSAGDTQPLEAPAASEGYAGLTVAKLKAEIGKRNKGRDDAQKLSAKGKQAELVALLEADDAATQD